MKQIIRKVHKFVKENCDYNYFSVEWDLENEMLGLKVFCVDDDYTNNYKKQAETIKKQIETEFDTIIDNVAEPSDYDVECLDVPKQVYMELDYLMDSNTEWLDYSVEVNPEWDGIFSDEREEDYW